MLAPSDLLAQLQGIALTTADRGKTLLRLPVSSRSLPRIGAFTGA